MDVLLKLRVLIWVLVLSLWGMLVYQFLGEEEAEHAQVQFINNPYKGLPTPQPAPGERALAATTSTPPGTAPPPAPPPEIAPVAPLSQPPPTQAPPEPESSGLAEIRTPDFLKAPAPQKLPPPRAPRRPMRPEGGLSANVAVPPGFLKRVTPHFNIYAEDAPATDQFIELLENLHGNLMLDLASFSPWAREQKVTVFLFKNQDTYRRITGRPAWSGGASSVPRRLIYLFESEELPGILAHELCHIFYDGFFLEGKSNPLWLSEGVATLVQVERGLAAPTWLRENLESLEKGDGYSMSELMSINSTQGAADAKVRLWYAQSYSIVRFLIRSQRKSSFYNFSRHLRDGRPVTEALYRAYGMPYNRLKALEYAWRYEITTNSISKLSLDASAK